jgi:hypothetical protein
MTDRTTAFPIVYEVAPFRRVWIVRRRGSHLETLHVSREEAIGRAQALCRLESRAELVILDPESRRRAG